jgi:hypothetical protein
MTFPTQHKGHSRHGLFLQDWIVNPMLNLLKKTINRGFEPGTFGVAVSIPNHYTIWVFMKYEWLQNGHISEGSEQVKAFRHKMTYQKQAKEVFFRHHK